MQRRTCLAAIGLVVAMLTALGGSPASAEEEPSVSAPQFTRLRPDHNRTFCMDVYNASTDPGAPVIQWPCGPWPNQVFEAIPLGNGVWKFKALHSSYCLDVYNASIDPGAQLIQWPCGNWNNQKFHRRFVAGGAFELRPVHNPLFCLDVYNASTAPGAPVIQWPCGGWPNQLWRL